MDAVSRSTEKVELFFLAENSVAEAVYYWGNSSNNNIFELMLLLVYLKSRGCFRLHIIWVDSTRQIASRINGFSKGCLTNGIYTSGSILDFVPLNKTAFDGSSTPLKFV